MNSLQKVLHVCYPFEFWSREMKDDQFYLFQSLLYKNRELCLDVMKELYAFPLNYPNAFISATIICLVWADYHCQQNFPEFDDVDKQFCSLYSDWFSCSYVDKQVLAAKCFVSGFNSTEISKYQLSQLMNSLGMKVNVLF